LSLVRQRALGQLTDVRVLDLRLSTSETRSLLRNNLNCDVSNTAVANLDQQLEGWVVGLKLATLPEHVRDCLTKAALLDWFCASLCDAICGTSTDLARFHIRSTFGTK